MIIDFHTHCFPDSLAPRAMDVLKKRAGMMFPFTDGTAGALVSALHAGGADAGVVLNIATNPRQERSVNDFAISLLNVPGLIPFGSVHPDSPDTEAELERLAAAGVKGVKFHPDYQSFFVDEERMLPVYRKIASLGLITVFHAGSDIGCPPPYHCTPERLCRALSAFDGAPVIAAHWGGLDCVKDTLNLLSETEVYVDTSFSYGTIPPCFSQKVIERFGAERILMGTDLPWNSVEQITGYLDCLGLSAGEKESITGGNACRLLGL